MIYDAGIGSNTLQDLIDRWDADVIAKNPQMVMLRIGTNSISDSAFNAKYGVLIDSLLAHDIFGFIHCLPPKGSNGAAIVVHNAWLAAQCAAHPTMLKYVDDSVDLGDGSYNFVQAYFSDDTHMSGKGMHAQGLRMAPLLAEVMTLNSPLIVDGTDTYAQNAGSNQWISNPLMAGAGTPTGWSLGTSGSGTVATGSIVAADAGDTNQSPWFRAAIASTGGAEHEVNFTTALVHPALAADATVKRLDVLAQVRLNGLSGAAINNIYMECRAGGNRVAPPTYISMPADETLTHTLVLRTSIARGDKYPVEAHAENSIQFTLSTVARAALASGVGSVDIRRVSVRSQGD